jgi:hypothetical protein
MDRPLGVTVLAIINFLTFLVLGFFLILLIGLVIIFGYGISITSWGIFILAYFDISAFLIPISIFKGSKSRYLWYASIIQWILLFAFAMYVYYDFAVIAGGGWGMFVLVGDINSIRGLESLGSIFLHLTPFIYPIGSTIYYFTEKPREYFGI